MTDTIPHCHQAAAAVAAIACPKAGSGDNGELKPWDGRSPLSIAAAIIYLVTRLPKVMPAPLPVLVACRQDLHVRVFLCLSADGRLC